MTRALLLLALITIASAQFSSNFTQVVLGWGSQGVAVIPANITDPDGTTYFVLNRIPLDQPEGQWKLDLVSPDGTVSRLENQNNDLVIVSPNGDVASIAAQLPPLLGITGPKLVTAVSNGVQSGVNSVYADPNLNNITTARANVEANTVVNQLLVGSSLPVFFLTPFRAQAAKQISDSLNNAQKVSAAINATLEAQNPPPETTPETPADDGSTANDSVSIPLNLTSFNIDSLNNVSQIAASYGSEGVVVTINSETEAQNAEDSAWLVDLETAVGGDQDNSEWNLSWVDGEGNSFSVYDENGRVVVVGADGATQGDWTTEAGWWANAEDGDVDAAIGRAIEDFVDEVLANANKTDTVAINVGDDGLNWNYAETGTETNA